MHQYVQFIRSGWPLLLFGLVTVFMGNIGQSFFISWYGAEIQRTLNLSAASYGSAYSVATLASGTTILVVGAWIDRMSLLKYTALASCGLFTACWLFFFSDNLIVLLLAFFMVRLCGQGLMPHTGFTTMARYFDENRGKAISVAASGVPLGEIVLPGIAVALIASVGWQKSWGIIAFAIPFLFLPSVYFLLKKSASIGYATHAPVKAEQVKKTGEPVSVRRMLLRDSRFWRALPAITAAPFVVTGIFIHQGFILSEKSWSPEFFAIAFVVYGIVHWVSSLGAGVMVDKFSAARLLPFYILPIILSLLSVMLFSGVWASLLMLAFLGVSIGGGSPIVGSLWAEIYGTEHLGSIRSTSSSFVVWSTAASPILFGFLIDYGITLNALLLSIIVAIIVASILAAFSYRVARAESVPI